MWDTIITILVVLGGIAMLWAISQLLRGLYALLKRKKKAINSTTTPFLHFNKPHSSGISITVASDRFAYVFDFLVHFNDEFNLEWNRMGKPS